MEISLKSDVKEIVVRHTHENVGTMSDSLEISTPAKGGAVKIYFDVNKPEEARAKIDAAMALRDYANKKLSEVFI